MLVTNFYPFFELYSNVYLISVALLVEYSLSVVE